MKTRLMLIISTLLLLAFSAGYMAAYSQNRQILVVGLFAVVILMAVIITYRVIEDEIRKPVLDITSVARSIIDSGGYCEFSTKHDLFNDMVQGLNDLQVYFQSTNQEAMEKIIESEEIFIQMIFMINAAVEAKDQYTSGHSSKVAEYAREIVNHLEMTMEMREKIILAASLHDVGKIGISETILNKKEKLTEAEYDKIKTHSAMGRDILSNSSTLWDILPYIYHHHEHYDGKGYPEGLSGEQIPLGARIIAVADAYDAMTSDRPYRKAMKAEKACQIMFEEKDRQFDGKIVEVFLNVLAKNLPDSSTGNVVAL